MSGKKWTDHWLWLLQPSYWCQNNDYSQRWDETLLKLLAAHRFEQASHRVATLGRLDIWIANHPYGSFSPYNPEIDCRPSRSTIMFARRRLLEDLMLDRSGFPLKNNGYLR